MSVSSKLSQNEYKIKQDLIDKVILLELGKKLKFNHVSKWYMHKAESILKNVMNKILWGFEIKTDFQILTRRPGLVIILL